MDARRHQLANRPAHRRAAPAGCKWKFANSAPPMDRWIRFRAPVCFWTLFDYTLLTARANLSRARLRPHKINSRVLISRRLNGEIICLWRSNTVEFCGRVARRSVSTPTANYDNFARLRPSSVQPKDHRRDS